MAVHHPFPPVRLNYTDDFEDHGRLLFLSLSPPSATWGEISILTVGHPHGAIAPSDEHTSEPHPGPPQLASPSTSLARNTSILVLPAPWLTYRSGNDTYAAMLRQRSGTLGTANSRNTSLTSYLFPAGSIKPLLPQSIAAIASSDPAAPVQPQSTLSETILARLALFLDPALRRPLGDVVPIAGGLIDMATASGPAAAPLAPLYIGLDLENRLAPFWRPDAGRWSEQGGLTRALIDGPGLVANKLLQAALDHEHRLSGRRDDEREEMRWFAGGGEALPSEGDTPGQPDFVLERRRGENEPWRALIAGETKRGVASPLLVELLRELSTSGSAALSNAPGSKRRAYDRLVTQMTQQMIVGGARCAVLWTGLDWVVIEREEGDESEGMQLRVWPRLLRATAMARLDLNEDGTNLGQGLTRHDLERLPGADEEEHVLNEVGLFLCLAVHARALHRDDDPAPRDLAVELTATSGASTSGGGDSSGGGRGDGGSRGGNGRGAGDSARSTKVYSTVALGAGSHATTHPAILVPAGPGASAPTLTQDFLVAKLARDRQPHQDDTWFPATGNGPQDFGTYTRRRMASEAAAYEQASDLQGTVLPELKAWYESDRAKAERSDDSGDISMTSLSSTASTASSSLGTSVASSRSASSPRRGMGERHPSDAPATGNDDDEDKGQRARQALTSPPHLLDGILVTWAGHSLRALASASTQKAVVVRLLGGVKEVVAAPPRLRSMLSEAGVSTAAHAVAELKAAVLTALDALHERGLAHGDVSAANICLTLVAPSSEATNKPCLQVKLIDLGNAKSASRVGPQAFAEAKEWDRSCAAEVVDDVVSQAWGDGDGDEAMSSDSARR